MIIEYMLKLDLVVTFVSFLTIVILFILDVPIPKALIWVFVGSLILILITVVSLQFYRSRYEK